MDSKMVREVGLAECMYCHSNMSPNTTCPVCGEVRPANGEVLEHGPKNLAMLNFDSVTFVQPQIAGV